MTNRNSILPAITIIGASGIMAGAYYYYEKNSMGPEERKRKAATEKSKETDVQEASKPKEGADQKHKTDEEKFEENLGLDDDEGSLRVIRKARSKRQQIPIWYRMDNIQEPKDTEEAPHKVRIFYRRKGGLLSTPLCLPKKLHDSTLLKQVLNEETYQELAGLSTNFGATLDDCIRPGLDNPEGNSADPGSKCCGIVACDANCYSIFRNLFNRVAQLRHPKYAKVSSKIYCFNLTKFLSVKLPQFDPTKVIRLDIEIHRNLFGHKFPSSTDRCSRRKTLAVISSALTSCTSKRSKLYDLTTLSNEDREKLMNLKLLPECPRTFYEISAGLRRDWPDGRGVWMCEEGGLLAVINVVDHLVLCTTTSNGKLDELGKKISEFYQEFVKKLNEEKEKIAIDEVGNFGCLTTFPELLGPALVFRAEIRWNFVPRQFNLILSIQSALSKNIGFVLKSLHMDENNSCTILTVETKFSLGYHDHSLLEMFEGGIERIFKLEKEIIKQSTSPS